tara:strand:- start:433 stop:891 length:459 start_codon:yes stop_codon:yes gene_type:complete
MTLPNVLVIEDGFEYINRSKQWMSDHFMFRRAGSGIEALTLLRSHNFDVVYLDMNFHRTPEKELLGDLESIRSRFGGDQRRALEFLSVHQGAYILSAIRDADYSIPVLFSYDFESESRRWEQLVAKYGALDWVGDNAGPDQVKEALSSLIGQ